MATISLEGLKKAEVLAALYNAARPQGMGFLHYDPAPMTADEAQAILDRGITYFDYVKGRVMKVDLKGNFFDPWLFDRDNGEGAAQAAIDSLRKTGDTNNPLVQKIHADSTFSSALNMQDRVDDETYVAKGGGMATVVLGVPDECRETLRGKVKKAKDINAEK